MDRLLSTLADWKPFKGIVVGDFMLDRQTYGLANRLSPDAPVPVFKVSRQENQPGGAANVCLDLAAMRGTVTAVGVTGHDEPGNTLRAELERRGISTAALAATESRPTTVKQNMIGLAQGRHAQKMFRIDTEVNDPIDPDTQDTLLAHIEAALKDADFLCIEDYNKGVCTPALCERIIDRCAKANVPVYVDPAAITDFTKYAGASVITPNRTELETALGSRPDLDPAHGARTLRTTCSIDTVVVTLDKQGALLERADLKDPVLIPTDAIEVYDVTGAGDMMIAALIAARANHAVWEDAVRFANAAAGLEVSVMGVVPMPIEKIHHHLLTKHANEAGATRSPQEAAIIARAAKSEGRAVVFTNGCFDVLHAGHISLLERAAALGDVLIVGLNTDHSVQINKGPSRPINDQEQRARVLNALACVDAVVLFDEETPIELIHTIEPDILVKGGDYTIDAVVGAKAVQSRGGRVEILPLVEGLSTTSTIEKMRTS